MTPEKNTPCKLPFNHSYINYIDQQNIPCCIYYGKESTDEVKKIFKENKKPDGCGECWRRENNNIISKRQYYSQNYGHLNEESGIKTYDLRLNTTCNLKCVMCGPHLSTKWKEDADIYEKYNGKVNNNSVKYDVKKFDFSDALEIYFAGGEPFYMKDVYHILKKMSNNSFNIENTKIRINTNGIIDENNRIFKILRKFKKIEITMSVEGFGSVNEYIRFPSKWERFLYGLKIISDITDRPKTIEEVFSCDKSIAFNISVSSLNLPNLFELFEWINTNDYVYVANFVEYPNILNINSLTHKVIDDFLSKHELYDYKFHHLTDIYQYIIKNYKFNEKNNQNLKFFLRDLDMRRNTDSEKILPWCWT